LNQYRNETEIDRITRNPRSTMCCPTGRPGPQLGSSTLASFAKPADETVVPDFIVPVAILTIPVPRGRVLLVATDNPIGEIRHAHPRLQQVNLRLSDERPLFPPIADMERRSDW
jgi:hypothetical protein